jgi:hypothetical protein
LGALHAWYDPHYTPAVERGKLGLAKKDPEQISFVKIFLTAWFDWVIIGVLRLGVHSDVVVRGPGADWRM